MIDHTYSSPEKYIKSIECVSSCGIFHSLMKTDYYEVNQRGVGLLLLLQKITYIFLFSNMRAILLLIVLLCKAYTATDSCLGGQYTLFCEILSAKQIVALFSTILLVLSLCCY